MNVSLLERWENKIKMKTNRLNRQVHHGGKGGFSGWWVELVHTWVGCLASMGIHISFATLHHWMLMRSARFDGLGQAPDGVTDRDSGF